MVHPEGWWPGWQERRWRVTECDQRFHGEGLCTSNEAQGNKTSHKDLEVSAVGQEQAMGREAEEVQKASMPLYTHTKGLT